MPRPRRARKRDYAAEYAARQRRARQLGYQSYYGRRVRAGGPPSQAAPTGARLTRVRGHRSRADFLASLSDGDLILLENQIGSIELYKDAKGVERYLRVDKYVIYADGRPDRTFTLRRLSREQMAATIDAELAAGAVFSPQPSLDQRRLISY